MAQKTGGYKETLWLERVRLWQQSQLSVRAFCVRRRLSEPSFYAWRRVLRQRGLLDEDTSKQVAPAATPPTFVKVRLDTAAAIPVPAIDVVLAQGRLLRVHPGFDAATLRQLLQLLEEPSC